METEVRKFKEGIESYISKITVPHSGGTISGMKSKIDALYEKGIAYLKYAEGEANELLANEPDEIKKADFKRQLMETIADGKDQIVRKFKG